MRFTSTLYPKPLLPTITTDAQKNQCLAGLQVSTRTTVDSESSKNDRVKIVSDKARLRRRTRISSSTSTRSCVDSRANADGDGDTNV